MSKFKPDQSGFGAIETALILIIATILGFTGWYVWHVKSSADNSHKTAATTNTVSNVGVPKATGELITTNDKKVAFNLDKGWVVAQRDDTLSGCGYQVESVGVGSCVASISVQPKDFAGKQASWTVQVFTGQTETGKNWPGGEVGCKLTDQVTQPINGYSAFSAKTDDSGCTQSTFSLVWNAHYIVLFSSFDNSQVDSFNKIIHSIKFL